MFVSFYVFVRLVSKCTFSWFFNSFIETWFTINEIQFCDFSLSLFESLWSSFCVGGTKFIHMSFWVCPNICVSVFVSLCTNTSTCVNLYLWISFLWDLCAFVCLSVCMSMSLFVRFKEWIWATEYVSVFVWCRCLNMIAFVSVPDLCSVFVWVHIGSEHLHEYFWSKSKVEQLYLAR